MIDEHRVVGITSYAGETTVHPLGLVAVAVLGLSLLLLPRRWSVIPMLMIACFVSSAQRIVIAGCDFDFLRIMVLFGMMRLILRRDYLGFEWRTLDITIVLWVLSWMFFFTFRIGTFSALINRLGVGFDAFGMYFLFRCLVRHWRDLEGIILGAIMIGVLVAVFFLIENRTGRNIFAVFGGVKGITLIRDGRLRCQGAFSHAILAGCFWASLIPLITAIWWKSPKDRIWAVSGIAASAIIVICCASSTPVMGVIAAMIGGLFFFLRWHMRPIRWGILLIVVCLHMVMKAPVWHLISRISAVGGSSGYHRFLLIDRAIENFGNWWVSGCSGLEVSSWGIYAGDVTNGYLLMGITGGIVTMGLFIAVICIAFREVGRLWRSQTKYPYRLALSWALGVSLFVHCINFIGVSYFGQIYIIWYFLLASISSLSVSTSHGLAAQYYVNRSAV